MTVIIGAVVVILIMNMLIQFEFEADMRIPENAEELGAGYYKTNSEVYFESGGGFFLQAHSPYKVIKIDDVEVETFVVLGEYYAKDKKSGYWQGKPFNADTQNLSFLSGYYAKDNNNVYFQGNIITLANAEKFKIISADSYAYAMDDKNIWFGGLMLSGADINTFKAMSNMYAKDKDHVWARGEIMLDADPVTFEVLSHGVHSYQKDKNNIWYNENKLSDRDPETFELLFVDEQGGSSPYSKDKTGVFKHNKPIDVDRETFEIVNNQTPLNANFVKDRNGVFCLENVGEKISKRKIEEANPDTFVLLNQRYAKDDKHVFYTNCIYEGFYARQIEGADVSTFEALDELNGKDKNYSYAEDRRVFR